MEASEKRAILRFSTRRVGKQRRPVEVVHFYSSYGVKDFHAYCERGVISSFLERVNADVRRGRKGGTIYLEGDRADDLFRRLIILAACRQCTRSQAKIPEIAEKVASLGEVATLFWYSRVLEEYEKRGFWGVCRVARAFRVLYRID
ncbi:hypothetical protein [Stygiolobus azoricus]|uniref:Uncharacterized protein n=1 Tax=Stygiolobus azoricus TaxID=41675 RepID=A0A650CPD7_9CREN|nr:hypothetical protein [Stygiolobus azoricus]QGR19701.1 hypothetical protein D1868_06620 [Stygiolobus azoricus]